MRKTIWVGLVAGCLSGGVFSSALLAQTNNKTVWTTLDFLRTDPWLSSENASGLNHLTVDNLSAAELSFEKGNGKFVNYYQSDNHYRYGAQAESFYRLDSRIVFYGKVSYSSSEGKHMWGASFIDPYANSFTVLESTDSTTRGEKKLEQYHLIGAVSASLTSRLAIGGKLDYTAANYAKFRDPRHKNSYTDIQASLGASYRFSGRFSAGVNGFYRRTVEGVVYKTYVGTELPYSSFINFGSFYGRMENLGSSGYTAGVDEQPMLNKYLGGSIQLDMKLSRALSFFNSFSYRSRSGSYGRNGTGNVRYTDHDGSSLAYKGVLSYKKADVMHLLSAEMGKASLENNENVYKYETQPGGNTTVVYYGETKMLDQDVLNAALDYKAYLGLQADNPLWLLNAGGAYTDRKQTTSLYPFFREQHIHTLSFYLNADRNFVRQADMYTVSLGLNYGTGGGTPKDDGLYATPSGNQQSPVSMDNLLMHEYEYLTADRIGAKVGMGYSRLFGADIRGYANLTYHFTTAQKINYMDGKNHHLVAIKIGCSF